MKDMWPGWDTGNLPFSEEFFVWFYNVLNVTSISLKHEAQVQVHHIALRFTLGKADRELYRPLGFESKIFHYETWPLVLSDGVILCLEVKSLCVCFCVDCADDSGPLLWRYGEWGGRPGSWDAWDWSVGVQGLRRDARQWKVKYDFCIKRIPCWKDPPFACWSRTLNFITFQVY